jgi:glycosyltransferase involved in cell wall biosynthesis
MPAYNEATRLPESFARMREYLDACDFTSEVVVVDDGSTDDTAALTKEWTTVWPALRLISEPHHGKGAAVRAGVLAARGEIIALADADLSMPPAEFDRLLMAIDAGSEIAIGSREAPGARRYGEPEYRHLMGRIFNRLVQIIALPGIQDTQCGFKCMRSAVAHDLCAHQSIDGWGFDVELLYIARLRGYPMKEVSIPWYYITGSRVHPVRDTVTMVRDVLHVRISGILGRYRQHAPERKSVPVMR